jgi:thioredoxin 1
MPAYIGGSRSVGPTFEPPTRKELLMSTVKVTDESFDKDVLQAAGPVLVDFWAEWCGPCKQIAPALEQISDELDGAVTIAKLNIEESPTTPSRYGVRGIPTMMLFKDGQMASMKVGAMPKQKILEWLGETGIGHNSLRAAEG